MTLLSRHRIQNLSPRGLRPSTLPFGHGCSPTILIFYAWAGKKHSLKLESQSQNGIRTRDLWLSKQAVLTTALGPRFNAGLTLVHCLLRCLSFKPLLSQRHVVVGKRLKIKQNFGETASYQYKRWPTLKQLRIMYLPGAYLGSSPHPLGLVFFYKLKITLENEKVALKNCSEFTWANLNIYVGFWGLEWPAHPCDPPPPQSFL